ncbi:hypothetical protein [Rummeliibacillus pycnus]|uniref:hypothetical protein n=1 Tax=Rummeliibacillus pycnus TaxID=101070 RepID=UPI000C9CA3E5|nr:hypothetical protein [Rummeliibacillus pycnus]
MEIHAALKQMQLLEVKQQLAFMLKHYDVFLDPVLYIIAVNDSLQQKLPFHEFVQLLKKQAIQKRNFALLKACNEVQNINI